MSISPVGQSSTGSTDTSAQVQLKRDEKKLADDTKAKASQAQLAADNAAIARDQLAIAQAAASGVDTFL